MSADNPYAASAAPPPDDDTADRDVTSADIAAALTSTSQWVRVFAVTFAGITALQLVGGLSLFILSTTAPAPLSDAYWRASLRLVVGSAVAVFPIIKLASFVKLAKTLTADNEYSAAADAITEQRVFWQYVGVVTVFGSLVAMVTLMSD